MIRTTSIGDVHRHRRACGVPFFPSLSSSPRLMSRSHTARTHSSATEAVFSPGYYVSVSGDDELRVARARRRFLSVDSGRHPVSPFPVPSPTSPTPTHLSRSAAACSLGWRVSAAVLPFPTRCDRKIGRACVCCSWWHGGGLVQSRPGTKRLAKLGAHAKNQNRGGCSGGGGAKSAMRKLVLFSILLLYLGQTKTPFRQR